MGYQENEEVYLTLPRKDLQDLCRKHGLPWNRNKPELAHLLVVHFTKQKEALQKRSKTHQQKLSPLPPQGVQNEKPVSPRKEMDRAECVVDGGACGQRAVTSEVDGCASMSFAKEKFHGHGTHSNKMAGKVDINVHIEKSNSTQAPSAAGDTAYAQVALHGVKDSACPKPGSGSLAGKPPLATNNRENKVLQQLHCEWPITGNNNEQRKLDEMKKSCQNLLNLSTTNDAPKTLPLAAWRNNSDQCSSENGLAFSSETAEVSAPFQFFARAEEGIKLYVDLNSTPSNWIKSFKKGICIYQRIHERKSCTICDGIMDTGITKHLKTSHDLDTGKCRSIGIESQLKRFEGNDERKNSSLIPAVSNGTDGPSRFSTLTSCCSFVELPECIDEENPVVTQKYDASCNFQYPLDKEKSDEDPQNPETAASVTHDSNAVWPNGYVNETIHRQSAPVKMQEPLNVGSVISRNSNAHLLSTSLVNASETSSIISPIIIQTCSKVSDSFVIQNRSGDTQISLLNESGGKSLLEVEVLAEKMLSDHQYDGQLILDSHVKPVQLNGGDLYDGLHGEHLGSSLANPISETPMLISSEHQNNMLHVKDKTRSRCSKVDKMKERGCKRPISSEVLEEFQRKRHHTVAEVDNGRVMNLRSTKALAKESISDNAVLHRRSLRLVSKPMNS